MALDLSKIMQSVTLRRSERRKSEVKPISKAEQKRQKAKEEAKVDHSLELEHSRARTQQKYHEKHRSKLNQARTMRARKPQEVYRRCQRRAKCRFQEWDFTFEEWFDLWVSAPRLLDPITGFHRTAWACKGGNYTTDTQMYRRDPQGPWSVSNCFIGINGNELTGE